MVWLSVATRSGKSRGALVRSRSEAEAHSQTPGAQPNNQAPSPGRAYMAGCPCVRSCRHAVGDGWLPRRGDDAASLGPAGSRHRAQEAGGLEEVALVQRGYRAASGRLPCCRQGCDGLLRPVKLGSVKSTASCGFGAWLTGLMSAGFLEIDTTQFMARYRTPPCVAVGTVHQRAHRDRLLRCGASMPLAASW